MAGCKTNIFVYAHWAGMPLPELIGKLCVQQGKGKSVFSFEYEAGWLKQTNRFLLDPDIVLFPGPQYPYEKSNFGIFTDSMPDSWGRSLMKRGESQLAKSEGRPAVNLHDSDFLLGVADTTRMGGLRFKLDPGGPFRDDDHLQPVPPLTSIGELQRIASLVESERESKELNKWLKILLAPGSSLGGARPKANLIDHKGDLWISKFPSKNDTVDKARWEYLAYRLAKQSGISMSLSRIEKVAGPYHTFLTNRFDRVNGERIHFASAMTMTGNTEETLRDKRASYLELAEFIQSHGGSISEDLAELWRRMVFNMAISNTDDHLRNHGFIIEQGQWRLSPAFDLNPSTDKEELALNIDEHSGILDFSLAIQVAGYFRLTTNEAQTILDKVLTAVSHWEKMARQTGISRSEIELMRGAFRGSL